MSENSSEPMDSDTMCVDGVVILTHDDDGRLEVVKAAG
jgi:hypothetical protein